MIQAASVVWLSLIGGRRRVAKNSHEPSGCCFLTISSAISFRLCFCPSVSEGNDCAATARNGSPMFSPRPCGRGSGGSAGLGKILEASNLSLLPSKDSVVSAKIFLVDRVPLPFGFAQRPKRHRHVMAGGALARVQPGGAFGLQVSDGAIDRLVDLLRCRPGCRFGRQSGPWEAKSQKQPDQQASHGSIPQSKLGIRQDYKVRDWS